VIQQPRLDLLPGRAQLPHARPRPGVGEKIEQFLHERLGGLGDGVAVQRPAEVLVADVPGVGLVLAQAVQNVGQLHRVGHQVAQRPEAVVDELVQVDVDQPADPLDGGQDLEHRDDAHGGDDRWVHDLCKST